MENIGLNDARALLKQAGSAIRQLVDDNAKLADKVAADERRIRIEKLAREMEDKNLAANLSFDEKVAALQQARNLDVQEAAVKMASPQGMDMARLGDQPGGGVSAFEAFIVSGEDTGD
jgi:hypothetical protein